MAVDSKIEVDTVMDRAQLSALSLLVLLLSFAVITFDGYDLICMSFVASPLAKEFGISVARFGPVFSAAVFGILIGGLVIGPVGDKIGRRGILLGSVGVFGLFSLLPVIGLSLNQLLLCRFITGIGLGGAMPSAAALTAEYAPKRLRSLFAGLMFAGVGTGGVVGGFLAARLVPIYGWRAAFWIGGLAPLVLLPLLFLLMPESIAFLASVGRRSAYIVKILGRIDSTRTYHAQDCFVCADVRVSGGNIAELFLGGRVTGTLLIWMISFCALFIYGLIVSWLPTVLTRAGLPVGVGILGPVALNLGGILGTVVLGFASRLVGLAMPICASLVFSAVGLLLVGRAISPLTPDLIGIGAMGFCIQGAVNITNALMTGFYPISIRSTGVGWALGAGRVGGIVGPSVGGLLLGYQHGMPVLFPVCAAIAILGAVATMIFGFTHKHYLWLRAAT